MLVLIVEDHESVSAGVSAFLKEAWPSCRLILTQSIAEAKYQLALSQLPVQLIIVDLELKNNEWGIELIAELRINYPSLKIIVHTKFDELSYLNQAIQNGADAYMTKEIGRGPFISCVKDVISFGRTVSESEQLIRERGRKVVEKTFLTSREKFNSLTPTEKKVIKLAILEKSRSQIGKDLGVGVETIKTHLKNINAKLGTTNRKEMKLFIQLNPEFV